jgi:hypothetical protein
MGFINKLSTSYQQSIDEIHNGKPLQHMGMLFSERFQQLRIKPAPFPLFISPDKACGAAGISWGIINIFAHNNIII